MSALAPATSPGISPRSPFYVRRIINSPLLSASTSRSSGIRLPREHFVESPPAQTPRRYEDASTQYSPEGYPPTAGRKDALASAEDCSLGFMSSSASRKRKGLDGPEPPGSSSSGSSAPSSAGRAPLEPDLRRHPSAPHRGVVAGPSSQPPSNPDGTRSTHGHSLASKRSKPEPGTTKVMPTLYQNCSAADLGHMIAEMLMELIRINDRIPLRDDRLTRFHSRASPGISVSNYLGRLVRHATLSPPILLSMVWYIDCLCQSYPMFTINSLTVHRFLITAATVSAKGLSDIFWTNPIYAKVGGIPTTELASLELELLKKMEWNIVPKPEVLEDYYRSLVERTEGYELERRSSESSESTSVGESGESDAEGML